MARQVIEIPSLKEVVVKTTDVALDSGRANKGNSIFGFCCSKLFLLHCRAQKKKAQISFLKFLQLLLAYVSTQRYEGLEVDKEMAVRDAKHLYKAGEKKLGTDEKTFIHIFSERSRANLAAIASAYHDMYGNSLKKVYCFCILVYFPFFFFSLSNF